MDALEHWTSPFPEAERRIWKVNLLEDVICQVRFPKLLVIDRDVPVEFQQRIYADYPILEEKEVVQFELQTGSAPGTQPILQGRSKEYHFYTKDRNWTVSLASNFVALKTTSYTEWLDFRAKFLGILNAFVDLYRPAATARIGLRYVNAITYSRITEQSLNWTDILTPAFDPLFSSLPDGAERIHDRRSIFRYQLSLDETAYVLIQHGLRPSDDGSVQKYVIDGDFYQEKEQDTNVEFIDAALCKFNSSARNLLYWALEPRFIQTLE